MASIMKVREREKEKKLKVEEFQNRLKTEEAQRIVEKLEYHDLKIAKSNNRNRDCLTMKAETLRRRNQSLSEKVSMFRTAEENLMRETVDQAKEDEARKTEKLRQYYKQEKQVYLDARRGRHEAFEYLKTRQGDNNQAVKMRNKQIMLKLKRSQKQVEDYIRNQNHELMLKQELRKLRVDDIEKK